MKMRMSEKKLAEPTKKFSEVAPQNGSVWSKARQRLVTFRDRGAIED